MRLLDILPCDRSASSETSRMTLLFFVLSGLDILGPIEEILNEERRQEIIHWIYSLQEDAGFLGSSFLKTPNSKLDDSVHVAMTYTALATLVILGDDLSRVRKQSILDGLRRLQNPDGSFMASIEEQCCDMRFVFCAASVCKFLNSFDTIDTEKMTNYILQSQTYEGGFGQGPDLEAHGGSTYCAIAALALLGKLETLDSSRKDKCLKWLVMRLNEGFHGRPNKDDDTCYTFWVGAAIKILSEENDAAIINQSLSVCEPFVLSTQDGITGGLAKHPDIPPDPLHTYLGLSGLALESFLDLRPVDPQLNVTKRARSYLDHLHKSE